MLAMPRPRPPHLRFETTRHGRKVWYVRVGDGPRVRLRAAYGTKEFSAEYHAAVNGKPLEALKAKSKSLRWLIEQYRASSAWSSLAPTTRLARDRIFTGLIDAFGKEAYVNIGPKSINAGIDRRRDTPHAANNFLKTMRGLFEWAKKNDHTKRDPTEGITQLPGENDHIGFHTWTDDEVEKFEAYWPVGSRQRLALDILLYTGLRRGDAVRLGTPHLRDGFFTIVTEKTKEVVSIPALAPLLLSIEKTGTGKETYLITGYGKSFAKAGFGNWFRDACDKAGVPGSAHGLRKAGATRAAENGASEADLNAIFGWKEGSRESATYVRKANRKKIAGRATSKLLKVENPNNSSSQRLTHEKGAAEKSET